MTFFHLTLSDQFHSFVPNLKQVERKHKHPPEMLQKNYEGSDT